jgi:curved DNA-binding protein CbpA
MRLTRRIKRGGGKKELAILGIPIPADGKISEDTIKKAFRDKSLATHPDKNKDSGATEHMRNVLSARKVLLDGLRNGVYTVSPPARAQVRHQSPARHDARPPPPGYNFGAFERRHAERGPPPGGPGRGFESSPPRANNFTHAERPNPHVYTRKKTPSPKRDVWSEVRQLHRNAVGRPRSNSGSDDEWFSSDLMPGRHRRNPPPKKTGKNPDKW